MKPFESGTSVMQTKLLMTLSAAFMLILGLSGLFMPQEILIHFGMAVINFAVLLIQISGSLYVGFAMLNWMSRENVIGGIYGRPVALANFLHFAVVAVTLLKAQLGGTMQSHEIWALFGLYSMLALWFGLVLFTHPGDRKT
jgi:hypothetical protein